VPWPGSASAISRAIRQRRAAVPSALPKAPGPPAQGVGLGRHHYNGGGQPLDRRVLSAGPQRGLSGDARADRIAFVRDRTASEVSFHLTSLIIWFFVNDMTLLKIISFYI
jgi:hypothetical protein